MERKQHSRVPFWFSDSRFSRHVDIYAIDSGVAY